MLDDQKAVSVSFVSSPLLALAASVAFLCHLLYSAQRLRSLLVLWGLAAMDMESSL